MCIVILFLLMLIFIDFFVEKDINIFINYFNNFNRISFFIYI
jgi:hypothetical protein